MFEKIKRLFKKSTTLTVDDLAQYIIGGMTSESGEVVNPQTAMSVSAVYACVGLISETIGQLPVRVKRSAKAGGSEDASSHPIYRLIAQRPNEWQTSQEFREMMTQHLCLAGNCYAEIVRDDKGIPRELLPLQPDWVSVEQDSHWNVTYKITDRAGNYRVLTQRDIFHMKYRTLDGYTGISPIGWQRESVGNSIAALNYSSRVLKNGGRPSGTLEVPGALSDDAFSRLKTSWESNYTGSNAYKTAILENGAKYNAISMSNSDMQFLESRKFSVEEIARIYRVPLHMIQNTDNTTSWGSGIEQMSIGFVQYSMLPWIKRWENCINKYLVAEKNIYVKLAVEGLMRGDMSSRYTAYGQGITNGFMSPNEVRGLEDLNPRDGGDDFLTPLNMTKEGGSDNGKAGKGNGSGTGE